MLVLFKDDIIQVFHSISSGNQVIEIRNCYDTSEISIEVIGDKVLIKMSCCEIRASKKTIKNFCDKVDGILG